MKVTLFKPNSLMGNIQKIEGTLIDHGFMEWAQYKKAPFVEIRPKRKRRGFRFVEGYRPYYLILEGWNLDLNPDSMYGEVQTSEKGIDFQESRYSSFNENWTKDFDKKVDILIQKGLVKVVADYRYKTIESELIEIGENKFRCLNHTFTVESVDRCEELNREPFQVVLDTGKVYSAPTYDAAKKAGRRVIENMRNGN